MVALYHIDAELTIDHGVSLVQYVHKNIVVEISNIRAKKENISDCSH